MAKFSLLYLRLSEENIIALEGYEDLIPYFILNNLNYELTFNCKKFLNV
jgi:hypothetical protein